MTTPSSTSSRRGLSRFNTKYFAIVLGALLAAVFAISCATLDRVIVAPPQIPGATFVGSEACATCHEEIVKDFKTADHAKHQAKGKNAEGAGCESCHGPGSLHVAAGGGRNTLSKKNIINPKKSPETCFQCHTDKRGEFSLPHTHPVLQGKMSCVDCHNPHKGSAMRGGGTNLHGENETCFKCHTAQRGPFVFEHEALREGCTTCHLPHGSVNAKMLAERNQNLCLKCHFQQQVGGTMLIGGRDHSAFVTRGTCWSGGCHEAMHGSQVNGSLRF